MASGLLDIDDVQLWYEELGRPDGTPVLLIMGGGTVAWWPPELVQGLVGAGCRVVQFDNRDMGLSTHVDAATATYGIDTMAGDALAVLDAVGIDAAHLVGLSLGGMIALDAALQQPGRVRSLTLVSSTPGPDPRLPKGDNSVFDCFDTPAETEEDIAAQTVEFCRALAGSRFEFDEDHYRAVVAADHARGTKLTDNYVPSSSSHVDDLARIDVLTLVVHGTDDPIYPFGHAEVLAAGLPQATSVRWDGVGHELPPPLVASLTGQITDHVATSEPASDVVDVVLEDRES